MTGTGDAGAANPWTARRPLNIAHQGGGLEAPSNTLFAFAGAVDKGSHGLELDIHATADGHLVVLHDATVDRTTGSSGRVDSMTLEQVRRLDAAHWFVPGAGAVHGADPDAYVWRGIATGQRRPPPGFDPPDFTIPTLAEVLERFPGTYVNIDIKNGPPDTAAYEQALVDLLERYTRADDVIVASFLDDAMARFKRLAPRVWTSAGPAATAAFWAAARHGGGADVPGHCALQVPLTHEGVTVVTEDFVRKAHDHGLAVHVWTIDDVPTMRWLLDIGTDGIVTDRPQLLASLLPD